MTVKVLDTFEKLFRIFCLADCKLQHLLVRAGFDNLGRYPPHFHETPGKRYYFPEFVYNKNAVNRDFLLGCEQEIPELQFYLGHPAFGDVRYHPIISDKDPGFIKIWNSGISDPSNGAIFMDNSMFNRWGDLSRKNALCLFQHHFTVFFIHHPVPEAGIGIIFVAIIPCHSKAGGAVAC